MQVGMYYWKTYVSGGGHVFHENMCYGRTCVVGGHVLQACAEATILAAVSLGIRLFFFLSTVSFICSETFLPRFIV